MKSCPIEYNTLDALTNLFVLNSSGFLPNTYLDTFELKVAST